MSSSFHYLSLIQRKIILNNYVLNNYFTLYFPKISNITCNIGSKICKYLSAAADLQIHISKEGNTMTNHKKNVYTKRFFATFIGSLIVLNASLMSCSSAKLGGSIATSPSSHQDYRNDRQSREANRTTSKSKDKPSSRLSDSSQNKENNQKPNQTRLIIYHGNLGLEVKNLEKSVQDAQNIIEKWQGYTEKSKVKLQQGQAYLVLRLPVRHFHQALAQVMDLGTVYYRNIKAMDITRKFSDLVLRLESTQKALARLQQLLRQTKKTKDRIKILKEINRLQEKIEQLTGLRDYYAKQAAFSTIYLSLKTKVEKPQNILSPSPFAWISGLSPTSRTIKKYKNISMPAPKKFFTNKKKFEAGNSSYLYANASNVMIRVGEVDNYPKADLHFWLTALSKEMGNRGYEIILNKDIQVKNGSGKYIRYQDRQNYQTIYYDIFLAVKEDSIYLIETFYPNKKLMKLNNPLVLQAVRDTQLD